jgi:nucleoside phosphorylase
VVVTMQAQDGTRNAAAITTDLIRSFPQLRCIILCGIAGGIPAPTAPERHVRLGDIIVATGGVVDYDHARTVNGRSDLRRSVEGLSRDLLRADRELEVKELNGSWPWRALLGAADRSPPRTFARPADGTDVLVQEGRRIDHPHSDRSGHVPGWPRVHRCAIASADRLVRDAVKRDEIAGRHGVLAIEMEATGLAVAATLHSKPWFVVRGVADYCDDASKNDVWHPYASLTAAAYLRALLAECPSFDRDPVPHRTQFPALNSPGGVRGDLAKVIDALLYIPQMRDDYQRRAIMSLLPDHIRTMVADNVNGRLHVLAMVQTCVDAKDGRERLLDALRLALPPESADLRRAEAAIDEYWPRRLKNDLEAAGDGSSAGP